MQKFHETCAAAHAIPLFIHMATRNGARHGTKEIVESFITATLGPFQLCHITRCNERSLAKAA